MAEFVGAIGPPSDASQREGTVTRNCIGAAWAHADGKGFNPRAPELRYSFK